MSDRKFKACRCSECDVDWPTFYSKACPLCGGMTWITTGTEPLDQAKAEALIAIHINAREREADFEAYYAEREVALLMAELEGAVDLSELC